MMPDRNSNNNNNCKVYEIKPCSSIRTIDEGIIKERIRIIEQEAKERQEIYGY
jgi:hypothetical protein